MGLVWVAILMLLAQQPNVAFDTLYPIRVQAKFGLIDARGDIIVSPQFEDIGHMHDQRVPVKLHGKWGFLDSGGNQVIHFRFREAADFSEGLAKVADGSLQGFIDTNGQWIIKHENKPDKPQFWQETNSFSEGLARIRVDGRYGYIDRKGQWAIPPQFTYADDFSDGMARVGEMAPNIATVLAGTNKIGYIDTHGTLKIPMQQVADSHSFKDGLAYVVKDGMGFGQPLRGVFIDHTGTEVLRLSPTADPNVHFSEGLVGLRDDEGWFAYADRSSKYVLYLDDVQWIGDFHEGITAICEANGSKCGFVGRDGKFVADPQFDRVSDFQGDLAGFELRGQRGYVNKQGRIVWYEGNRGTDLLSCPSVPTQSPRTIADLFRQSPMEMLTTLRPIVEGIRGKTLQTVPALRVLAPDDFRAAVNVRLKSGHDDRGWRVRSQFLKDLGFTAPNTDLLSSLTEVASKTEAVIFDFASNTILIQEGLSPLLRHLAIVSGIAQAIDAQNFGYAERWNRANDEERFAIEAIFRGSASLVVNSYLSQLSLGPASPTPDVFGLAPSSSTNQQPTIATYYSMLEWEPATLGTTFVARGRERRLYALCTAESNRALEHGVNNGVDVFRPRRYWSTPEEPTRPKPVLPNVPPQLGRAWVSEATSMGFFPIHFLGLSTNNDEVRSRLTPAAFISDRLFLYSRDSDVVSLWIAQWSTNDAAQAFKTALEAKSAQLSSKLLTLVQDNITATVAGRSMEDEQKIAAWALAKMKIAADRL